jgi:hypothetical protein
MVDREDLQNQLQKALKECALLREENERLRKLLGLPPENHTPTFKPNISEPSTPYTSANQITSDSPLETRIALFRSLFHGREDVYPIRWEGRKGNSGYSPACANEWNRTFCRKPMVKCSDCENRELRPVTDEVIRGHLPGKHTIGVYPLLLDETCWFLVVDFDKKGWQEDTAVFFSTCKEMGIQAALERSRSGKGGHVWMFFDCPVPASLARRLGCAVLTRSMERRHQIGLDSYDRFFPSQDTMPKGGFGNLIALPLQRVPAEKGNSVFVNEEFEPYADQWMFLSAIKRIQVEKVESVVQEASRNGAVLGVRISFFDEGLEEDP